MVYVSLNPNRHFNNVFPMLLIEAIISLATAPVKFVLALIKKLFEY